MPQSLLSHQERFLDALFEKLENNKLIIVTGASGCGKSYCFQWVKNNITNFGFENALILDSDYLGSDQNYTPFKEAIFTFERTATDYVKQGVVEAAKDSPFLGNFMTYIAATLLNHNAHGLNDEELVLINQFKKLNSCKKNCIICDNIHWWDKRSLKLLMRILTSQDLFPSHQFSDLRFILSITNNQKNHNDAVIKEILSSKTIETTSISFPKFDYAEFKNCLYQETYKNMPEVQSRLLFNLVNGHLKVFFEVVNEINQNSFDFDIIYDNNKAYLDHMLNRRLQECGATGTQIMQILEYASVIGINFSGFELQQLTEYKKSVIKKILIEATTINLTENNNDDTDNYRFAHDIIRELFKSKVDANHIDYYCSMSLCLKTIKPGQYLRRARYMTLSLNTDKAAVLFCLEIVSQLRNYGDIMESLLQEASTVISVFQKEYLKCMEGAYIAYHQKDYPEALNQLDLILGYYPEELLAERDILKLRCYSKQLASPAVSEKIHKLDDKRKKNFLNGEKEISERYMQALITAYAHLGEITKAQEIEEEVMASLAERIDFDEESQIRLNIIKRNANAIHGIDTAPIFMQQAVDYFSQLNIIEGYRTVRQLYTSIINYSAILIKQGEFFKAYEQAIRAFKLEQDNVDINFPRTQILRNNYILACFLDGKINVKEAINLYHNLLDSLLGVLAEKLFYTSNLSIMYALDNQPYTALQILKEEANKHSITNDKEGLYKYRVETNCAIYQYLLGEEVEAISRLTQQQAFLQQLINGSYFSKKNEILIHIMRHKMRYDGQHWLSAVHAECEEFQGKPWRYFGLGFAFAALCDWGI